MIHRTRSRLVKLSIAVFGAAALLVTIPAPASAGRGDHDRYVQHDCRHVRHHGDHHGGYRSACRHRAWRVSHKGRHGYHHREMRYTCKPCGRRFHTGRRLHDHRLHHHQVPPPWFPFPAVHVAWSWNFPG
jgi:hypothetical protein